MISSISWTDYLIGVALVLALYYLYVGVRYFSSDLKALLSGKHKFRLSSPHRSGQAAAEEIFSDPQDAAIGDEELPGGPDEYADVEQLIARLKAVIGDASQKVLVKPEFKHYLHLVFSEYPSLKDSPLRASINELVASECEQRGTVRLSEQEVEQLW